MGTLGKGKQPSKQGTVTTPPLPGVKKKRAVPPVKIPYPGKK